MKLPKYSVVIPVFNEQGSLVELDKRLHTVMKQLGSYEIIYVDDGSVDGSSDVLEQLNGVVITLARNYGQATALDAGFKEARGEIIISMDADLQNDPSDIPRLITYMNDSGLDVVAGWRKVRRDSVGIRFVSGVSRILRQLLIHDPVHDTGCTLRVYRRAVLQGISLSGEMHRYLLAMLRWRGARIGEMVVRHHRRKSGYSKYGYGKVVRGMIDLLYIWFIHKYHQRPLHVFGYLSVMSGMISLLGFVIAGYDKIFMGVSLNRSGWFLIGIFLGLAGILLFSFGIIIDLLLKIHLQLPQGRRPYTIIGIRR